MRASAIEFRLRVGIMVIVIALGFWSPWIEAWGIGRRMSLLEWLALELSRSGLVRFTVAIPLVIVTASLIALLGAVLRIWGTAYLGPATVNNGAMKAGQVMAAGPYRYVRNPLYVGSWCMVATMAFIMPPTGALLVLLLLTVFLFRLILGEEAFLSARLGETYRAYFHAVPRIIPQLRSSIARSNMQPDWPRGVIAEINPIGIFFTMAVLSWRYDHDLMVRGILISFGISLVVRALLPRDARSETAVEG